MPASRRAHSDFELHESSGEELGFDADLLAPLIEITGPLAVVDLETTGLPDDPHAEILELGILTFDFRQPGLLEEDHEGGVQVRVSNGFVRPAHPIPLAIQRLTGILDTDVERAPRIDEVREELADALRGRTIVAHNADFEQSFLSRFVSRDFERATFLDTQDLLALTHPDSPDLRLESFTQVLLERVEQHRALEDAADTVRVLARIAEAAAAGEARYLTARSALDRYAPDSPWRALLGRELLPAEREADAQFIPIEPSEDPPVPFDVDAIAEVLADAERGARYFPGYRVRKEQIDLARHFARNLQDGGTLLLEGGTGVGKSLAYLAAVIPFAAERRKRGIREPILISTRTKLLQDQLLRKDIAAAARFLGHADLQALSIKGRANYVCQRRLEDVLAEGRDLNIFPQERLAYAVLMSCAATRRHAEIGALPAALLRRYPALHELRRRSVAARAEQCSREDCAKTPGCPFGARRAALARADVVIANHDLLLRWPPDYPSFSHVIVDEGHELAGVADEVFAQVVRPGEVLERMDEIFGKASERGGDALLPRKLRRRVAADVSAWRREIFHDLSGLGSSLAPSASDYGEVQLPPLPERMYPEAAQLAELSAARIEEVARQAVQLDAEASHETDDLPDEEGPVAKAAADLRHAASGLRLAFEGVEDYVSSFDGLGGPAADRWSLSIRPVSPASSFHTEFMGRLESFAAVSASLFVAGDAFASTGELEIEERSADRLSRVTVESPFPYATHMRVVALRPSPDLVEETVAVLERLARELNGRTLGLFTSLRRMNDVAERLDQRLRGSGIEVLSPRRAADDPSSLVERFVAGASGSVLLGARTFWQGIDVPGEALQAVVIEKLPFEVPTELRKRRELRIREHGGDPFNRFTMGKMLLHLKQMAGRLIRSESDRGVVVIVDARTDRRYFRRLQDAFPSGTRIRVGRPDELPAVLAEIELGSLTGEDPG